MSWDELVAAALIGTDRRPVAAVIPDGAPAGLERALAERGAEDRLLSAAAAWTVARRAGAIAREPVTVEPAEADARPIAPGTQLRAMLEGTFPALIGEWLALADERGLRPPPELIPELLDHALYDPRLHAAAGEAAGPVGRWLAERSPRWAFVRGAGDDVEVVWADGERAERRALLERLRRTDPDAGRELLAATFGEETWEDRVAFVSVLADGLSAADEPLLETALDDRRKPVRDAAAALLARVPGSAFAARMAARTAPLLRVEDARLVAALPDAPDASAQRDGVPAGGRRSERLRALLAATPLATWTAADAARREGLPATGAADAAARGEGLPATGAADAAARGEGLPAADVADAARGEGLPAAGVADAARGEGLPAAEVADAAPRGERSRAALPAPLAPTPAELVALPVADDLAEIVHGGWAEAAIAQRDADWARALWAVRSDPELLRALDTKEAQRLAAAAPEPDVAARALPGPWGPELSHAVIGAIERRRKAGERGQDVAFAGHRLDPALAEPAEERLRDLGGRDLWTLCDILAARAAMLRELS